MLPCCAVLCYTGHGLLPAASQAARFACDLSSAQANPLGMDWGYSNIQFYPESSICCDPPHPPCACHSRAARGGTVPIFYL